MIFRTASSVGRLFPRTGIDKITWNGTGIPLIPIAVVVKVPKPVSRQSWHCLVVAVTWVCAQAVSACCCIPVATEMSVCGLVELVSARCCIYYGSAATVFPVVTVTGFQSSGILPTRKNN